MKNIIILALMLATLCPSLTFAQFRVGPTLGFNLSSMQHSSEARETIEGNFEDAKILPLLRLQIGATAEYALSDRLYLQSGLLINGGGVNYKYNYNGFGVDVKGSLKTLFSYIDIPLTARYQLAELDGFSLSGWGGFIVGIAAGGKYKLDVSAAGERDSDSESIDFGSGTSDDMKSTDFRLALGVIAESDKFPIQLKAALNQGMVNLVPRPGDSGFAQRNFLFSVSASYFFELD